jgi:RNA polymerase sigma factor (sigma-70 family)
MEARSRESISDAELLAKCKAGSEAAWQQLIRRYQRLIYTVPRRAGLSDDQAADVFQITFSRLYENMGRIEQPDRLQAWLVTTARRETLQVLEQGKRTVSYSASDSDDDDYTDPLAHIPDEAPLPDEVLETLQTSDLVRRALDRLDDRSKTFLTMLFLQDEAPSYAEIAARLGISEGSIGPTRMRCLAKLKAALQEVQ